MLALFGNSAKDCPGVVPLSAPGEDQRKSAQRVSPLLLFTSVVFFGKKRLKDAERFCFLCRFALLYTWLSFRVREITATDAGVTRESFLAELRDEDEQTGELQLEGGCYRGGSSSMGSSSGLRDFAARQGGRGRGERKEGWA